MRQKVDKIHKMPFIVGNWCKIDPNLVDPSDSLWLTINDGNCEDNESALQGTLKVSNLEERNLTQEKADRFLVVIYQPNSGRAFIHGDCANLQHNCIISFDLYRIFF